MGYLIGIDAGHGANTSGKRTPDGYREHWANAKVAEYFAEAMERCGIAYIKVGFDDANGKDDLVDVPLSTRQKKIREAKCDHSISFHFNAAGDGKTYNEGQGVVVHIHNNDNCVGDSAKMAQFVHDELIKGTQQKDRGVKRTELAMCNCRTMDTIASILVECAFMTNRREAELMQDDAFCLECAEEAAKGYCNYIGVAYVSRTEQPAEVKAEYYAVKKGDTLSKIGKALGIPWKSIAELNNISFPYLIRVDQILRVK